VCNFRQIEAEMDLLVDGLALPGIGPFIGEAGFHGGIDHRKEGAGPEKFWFGLKTQISQRLVVRFTHLAVDIDEARDQIAVDLVIGIDLVDNAIQTHVLETNGAGVELLRENLVPEIGPGLRAGRIGGVDPHWSFRTELPGEREQAEVLARMAGQGKLRKV